MNYKFLKCLKNSLLESIKKPTDLEVYKKCPFKH